MGGPLKFPLRCVPSVNDREVWRVTAVMSGRLTFHQQGGKSGGFTQRAFGYSFIFPGVVYRGPGKRSTEHY